MCICISIYICICMSVCLYLDRSIWYPDISAKSLATLASSEASTSTRGLRLRQRGKLIEAALSLFPTDEEKVAVDDEDDEGVLMN